MDKKIIIPTTRVWKKSDSYFGEDILNDCVSLFETSKVISFGDSFTKINRFSMLRNVFTKDVQGSRKCVRDLIINFIDNADKSAPGSGCWLPRFILHDVELLKVGRLSTESAMTYTQEMVGNDQVKSILKILPKTVSNTAKILVQSNKGIRDKIEISLGYKFSPTLHPLFSKIIGTSEIHLSTASVLIVEGSPATVGEITKLLESAAKEKRNLIFIARSFPDDVISTLATNWLKKSLNIVPMIYGDKIENINLPSDLGATTGSVPVSPMFGDTLTMDLEDKLGTAKNIRVSKDLLVFSSDVDPTPHVENLYTKLKNMPEHQVDQRLIIIDRIAGLSNELATISLAEKNNLVVVLEELKIALLYYNHMCYSAAEIKIGNESHVIPYIVYNTAKNFSEKFKKVQKSIGGFLVVEN